MNCNLCSCTKQHFNFWKIHATGSLPALCMTKIASVHRYRTLCVPTDILYQRPILSITKKWICFLCSCIILVDLLVPDQCP